MNARSRSACVDCATSSGILHVTHMTWRSIAGRVVFGAGGLATAGEPASAAHARTLDRAGGEARARRAHELCASSTARSRNALLISPREIATMRPRRSMMKLSGSWSVP